MIYFLPLLLPFFSKTISGLGWKCLKYGVKNGLMGKPVFFPRFLLTANSICA